MQAMLTQLDPGTVLTKFQEIARAGTELVHVDLPASQISTFLDLSRKARSLPVGTTSFVPPLVQTSDPDFYQIRQTVEDAIDGAEAADERGREGADESTPSPVPTVSAEQEDQEAEPGIRNPANATGDLGGAC
jgi:hypothetical protein